MLQRDPELLERVEACDQLAFEGTVHRVVWADVSPLQGSSVAHGRWNSPDNGFEVLNTSLDVDGAAAEFEAFWSLFEQRPDRAALNWTLRVRLERVVELDFAQLERLGVRQAEYRGRDYARTQEISDALNYFGCDGLIAPSARHEGRNLVVYMRNLGPGCLVEEAEPGAFAWRESGDVAGAQAIVIGYGIRAGPDPLWKRRAGQHGMCSPRACLP